MSGALHRVYFALWPDEALRAALAAAVAPVLAGAGGRPVLAADLHVTLEFIGEVAPPALAALVRIGASIAPPPVTLTLDRLEWWSGSRALVVAASAPPASLMAMQQGLRQRVAAAGLRVDAREYRPHLTIARGVPAQPWPVPALSLAWQVGAVALVESAGAATGARYRPLAVWHAPGAGAEFHVF